MLYFQDHRWARINGRTRFDGVIWSGRRPGDEVFWMLNMHYVAMGPEWRRVKLHQRPELKLEASSLKPGPSWKGLEKLDFWPSSMKDEPTDPLLQMFSRPWVDITYRPKPYPAPPERTVLADNIWRVVKREGRWLTIELAAFASGKNPFDLLKEKPVQVTQDGKEEEEEEPDVEFWKKNAELYLLDDIPFGKVTVYVPRNASDPMKYAVARCRTLMGTGEPEHFSVRDFAMNGLSPEDLESGRVSHGDLIVDLHFHGYYED